ncbi:MAG: hypothetical protein JNK45_26015 [Myxococcales bacterium]|nr:hypothetical protein [Myxococcales bacterium]
MVRPLSPWPILAVTAIVGAIAWSSPWLDDLVGIAAVVGICDGLLWLGLRGDPRAPPGTAARVALAIGGAVPAAATALTFIPWFADGDGMQGLAVVVGMLIFGLPLAIAGFAVALFLLTLRARAAALDRVLVVAGGSIAIGWVVAIAWALVGGGSTDVAVNVLAFPGFATAALILPLLERQSLRAAGQAP